MVQDGPGSGSVRCCEEETVMCDVERTAGEAEMVRRQAVCGIAPCLDSRPVNRVTDPTRTATGSARIQLLHTRGSLGSLLF